MEQIELTNGIKKVQLEIVREIERICKAHNIRYFLAYGTLIGAVRHKGFIPWDDDIDVMMPYPDLQKFEQVIAEEMDSSKFFYQSPTTEAQYRLTISRVRRNGTVMLEKSMEDKDVHKGIFVDIYPLYGAAPSGIKRKCQVIRAMLRALYLLDEPVRNHGALMKVASTILLKLKTKKGKEKTQQKLFVKIAKYDYNKSSVVTVLDSGVKEMSTDYLKSWFGEGTYSVFEDIELVIPVDSHSILEKYYGDYMQLPPEEERKVHHDYVEISLGEFGEYGE